jgi:uncharacterized protein (DUF1330 family)
MIATVMSYFFYANIRINNQEEYQIYLDSVDEVFEKYNGEYLAVDESPEVLEGEWNYTKSVLIKFNTKQEFEAWYYSDDYQKILKHRLLSADCDSILIKGF